MTYQIGETARLQASVTDSDAAAADPSTIKITIQKPDGTAAVTAQDMTKSAAGTYYYDYTVPSDTGMYQYNIIATGASSRTTIVKGLFRVDAVI